MALQSLQSLIEFTVTSASGGIRGIFSESLLTQPPEQCKRQTALPIAVKKASPVMPGAFFHFACLMGCIESISHLKCTTKIYFQILVPKSRVFPTLQQSVA